MKRHQRGAALLTAMIIVTLIASLAAGMVWQQYRAVQIEAADRARAQSGWILTGALDWARLILHEDIRTDRKQPPLKDHLGEPWAVPLAEARLSTFLAADKNATSDEGPEAFLSGSIEDAQSRYNLLALLGGAQVNPLEYRVLQRLCTQVNAAPNTADVIVAGLRSAFPAPPASAASGAGTPASAASTPLSSNRPLQPAGVEQLAWLGVEAETIKRLQPYVVLLPKPTPVNVNTAPREVLAAVFDGMNLAVAERLVQGRKAKPLRDIAGDLLPYLPAVAHPQATPDRVAVNSSFFVVTGRLRLDERQLEQRSLVERDSSMRVNILARERINQLLDR